MFTRAEDEAFVVFLALSPGRFQAALDDVTVSWLGGDSMQSGLLETQIPELRCQKDFHCRV